MTLNMLEPDVVTLLRRGEIVAALRAIVPDEGMIIRDGSGAIAGAVGITVDSSDNDETCALAGIVAAGLVPKG